MSARVQHAHEVAGVVAGGDDFHPQGKLTRGAFKYPRKSIQTTCLNYSDLGSDVRQQDLRGAWLLLEKTIHRGALAINPRHLEISDPHPHQS